MIMKPTISINDLTIMGLFTALLCILSQFSFPTFFSPVPITVQCFGIALVGVVLGWRLGLGTIFTYILLGAIGIPVFSNFHSGLGYLFGMTGGYILSWPLFIILCGIYVPNKNRKMHFFLKLCYSLLGLVLHEISGIFYWSMVSNNMDLKSIITYSISFFIPKDIFLTIAAVSIGIKIRNYLLRHNLLV